VITYCNRGKQSALTYFVLRKLGYKVSVYDGAWLEWGNDDQLPISQMSTSVSQNM
jgi:thiosulfate/3-mercaptopyruvate sulfurtransferase